MGRRIAAWLAKVGIATAILAGVGILENDPQKWTPVFGKDHSGQTVPGRAMASPAATHQETRS